MEITARIRQGLRNYVTNEYPTEQIFVKYAEICFYRRSALADGRLLEYNIHIFI